MYGSRSWGLSKGIKGAIQFLMMDTHLLPFLPFGKNNLAIKEAWNSAEWFRDVIETFMAYLYYGHFC